MKTIFKKFKKFHFKYFITRKENARNEILRVIVPTELLDVEHADFEIAETSTKELEKIKKIKLNHVKN